MKNEKQSQNPNKEVQKEEIKKTLGQIFDRCSDLFDLALKTFPEKKTDKGREVGVFAFTFNFAGDPKSIWILGEKKHDYSIDDYPVLEDYRSFEIRFSAISEDKLEIPETIPEDFETRFRVFNFDELEHDIYTYPDNLGIKPTHELLKRVLKNINRNVTGIRARMRTINDVEKALLSFLNEIKEGKEKPRALIDSRYEETRIPIIGN